jgi:hypothetical protein
MDPTKRAEGQPCQLTLGSFRAIGKGGHSHDDDDPRSDREQCVKRERSAQTRRIVANAFGKRLFKQSQQCPEYEPMCYMSHESASEAKEPRVVRSVESHSVLEFDWGEKGSGPTVRSALEMKPRGVIEHPPGMATAGYPSR